MNRRRFMGLSALSPLAVRSSALEAAPPARQPLVVLPDSAHVYDSGHGQTQILVGTEQSGGKWWLGSQVFDPGRKTSLHLHYNAEEQFYVIEGKLSVWIEDRWHDLPVGAVAEVPRRVAHALANRTDQSVRFLLAGQPAGFERYFADLEAITHQFEYGSPDFWAALAKVYTKFDSKLLGPPPD